MNSGVARKLFKRGRAKPSRKEQKFGAGEGGVVAPLKVNLMQIRFPKGQVVFVSVAPIWTICHILTKLLDFLVPFRCFKF